MQTVTINMAREGSSEAVKQAAQRVLTEYWVSHGREAACADSVARVKAVGSFLSEIFFVLASKF